MLDAIAPGQEGSDELLVKGYLSALSAGRFIDALNAFSMDASFRDESGSERHGIREIAASFARRERPLNVEIEDLRRDGHVVSVRVRMSFPGNRKPQVYSNVFRLRRDRISSLEIDPFAEPPSKKDRLAQPG